MTAWEMHLEFEQSLQQIAAHKTRKYHPEEIDWILNKIQNRFIQSKVTPKKDGSGGFEINELQTDAIQTLITHAELTPWIDEGKGRYKCYLPHDYAYLLSDYSYTIKICNSVTPEVVSTTFQLYGLKFPQSTKDGNGPYYITLNAHMVNDVVIPTDLPPAQTYSGLARKDGLDILRPFISLKGEYWWERYGDIYRPGYFLQPKFTAGSISPSLTIDGLSNTSSIVLNLTMTKNSGEGILTDNRLTATNKIAAFINTEFYNTTHYSPISELAGNLLYVYNDNSFTVSKVGISYIRKCLPISLSLGTNCELPEQFHQTICDLAVEYVKGRLDDAQGQQLAQNDNENRVIL